MLKKTLSPVREFTPHAATRRGVFLLPIPVYRADALPFGEGGRAVARSGEVQENLSISHYIAANSETFSTSSVTPVGVPPSPEGKAYLPDKWQFIGVFTIVENVI